MTSYLLKLSDVVYSTKTIAYKKDFALISKFRTPSKQTMKTEFHNRPDITPFSKAALTDIVLKCFSMVKAVGFFTIYLINRYFLFTKVVNTAKLEYTTFAWIFQIFKRHFLNDFHQYNEKKPAVQL